MTRVMTKKDFELVAHTLYGEVYSEPGVLCEAWEDAGDLYEGLVVALAMAFKKENPRFDGIKFYKACGLEG